MKELIEKLVLRHPLSVVESADIMRRLLTDPVDEAVIAAVLVAIQMRGITLDELDGFSSAILELSTSLDLSGYHVMDVCGTGGDNKSSFNVSTTVAFVLAGAGYNVAKHGNYAVSSSCGSSNVLEELGVRFATDTDSAQRALDRAGVCFLHAPLFHPLLKRVSPIRKMLGIRTIFNVLGPLVNPAQPKFQLSGVYDFELLQLYSSLLQRRGRRFAIVNSFDGYDEVSLTGPARIAAEDGVIEVSAADFGYDLVKPGELAAGATVRESAEIVRQVLNGCGSSAQEHVVVANAAVAMWKFEKTGNLQQHAARASEVIRSGKAAAALRESLT
jgi:anthranilate phosphoribosyltransferase